MRRTLKVTVTRVRRVRTTGETVLATPDGIDVTPAMAEPSVERTSTGKPDAGLQARIDSFLELSEMRRTKI